MFKKITIVLLSLLVVLGISSCNNQKQPTKEPTKVPTVEPTKEPTPEATNEINIIVLCGQSNAEGHTWWIEMQRKNPALYKKYLNKEDSVLKMKYNCDAGRHVNDEYESVKFGMGFNNTRFGPEVGMNEALEGVELTRPTYILKYTVGGTNLFYQWKSYSSGSSGQLYDGMILYLYEELEALVEAGFVPYVKAICWMQGESDSNESDKVAAYGEYLNNFINDLNTDLVDYVEETDEKIKFIDAGISESSAWKGYKEINQHKVDVEALDPDHRTYIDTIGMGLDFRTEPSSGADIFHYDCLSMIELGKAFMEEILKYNVLK